MEGLKRQESHSHKFVDSLSDGLLHMYIIVDDWTLKMQSGAGHFQDSMVQRYDSQASNHVSFVLMVDS